MVNKKNILFYSGCSVSRSKESEVVFLKFNNENDTSQTIAITYRQAHQLALQISENLKNDGYKGLASKESHLMENRSNNESFASKERRAKIKRISLDPNASIHQLQTFFKTGTPEVRLQVVRVLAKRKDERGLFLITKASVDADPRVRRLATEALGHFPCQDCVNLLMDQLRDSDKVVKLKAIDSLTKIGDNSVAPALKEVISDPSVTIRRNVTELLSSIGGEKMVITFGRILKDHDPQVRLMATKALARIGGPIAGSTLSIALKDQDPKIREIAVGSLGEVGNASIAPMLLNIINLDEVSAVRQKAAESLAKLGEPVGLKQLLRILKNSEEEEGVRAAVANAIGRLGGMAEVPALISMLKEHSSILRMNATIALGKLAEPSAIPTLKYILETDPDAHVRGSAALALGEMKNKNAVPFLCKALRDKNSNVRASAAEALGKLKFSESIEILEIALEDQDDFVRSRAAQAIEKIHQ